MILKAFEPLDPGKPLPGTDWHPWFYLREMVMLALALASLMLGSHHVRRENSFDYLAIAEVAILFIGIFVSMKPALQILGLRGAEFGLDSPAKYFWASGWLSSVLDNAPTYLVFFEAAEAETANRWASAEQMAKVAVPLLKGVSLGSVCMGAMTYIGNGPNFMVKTIAEKFGIAMPSFFSYLLYSFGVLLPILALNVLLFSVAQPVNAEPAGAECRIQRAVLGGGLTAPIPRQQFFGSRREHSADFAPLAFNPGNDDAVVAGRLMPHPGDDGGFGPLLNRDAFRSGDRAATDRRGVVRDGCWPAAGQDRAKFARKAGNCATTAR